MTISPDNKLLRAALYYAEKLGWYVLPLHTPDETGACSCRKGGDCPNPGKHPRWEQETLEHGVLDATTDPDIIRGWWKRWPGANVGIAAGKSGLIVIDQDGAPLDLPTADRETVTNLTARGAHLIYAKPADLDIGNRDSMLPGDINVRGDGGLFVAPPSRHASGKSYQWEEGYGPHEMAPLPLPQFLRDLLKPDETRPARAEPVGTTIGKGARNATLLSLAGTMRRRGLSQEAILAALLVENDTKCSPPLGRAEVEGIAQSIARYEPTAPISQNGKGPDHGAVLPSAEEHLTDMGNAARLARMHGADLRYTVGRGWFVWVGSHWGVDRLGEVQRRAKAVALSYYADAADGFQTAAREAEILQAEAATLSPEETEKREIRIKAATARATAAQKWAKASQASARIDAMISLARSECIIAVEDKDFDRYPWLLNVENGTIDLRTGDLRPHDRAELLTIHIPVVYDPNADCPLWYTFLDRVQAGNGDLVAYLQRLVGYCLTGDVSDQALYFLYGGGANGKSTFINTVMALLGGYAGLTAPDLLVVGQDRHPTELADLQGRRLMASIEVEDGRRMAEGLVKQLTGGDTIKARLMRQDFFDFQPTHKLWLVANHKPAIRGTDWAIWRRIRLIPFTITIPEDERDMQMGDKLRAELPGILNWAIRGCLMWQARGMNVPSSVGAATAAYRSESDILGAFLDECTVQAPDAEVQASALYKAYSAWCNESGNHAVNQMRFGNALTERGFEKDKGRIVVYLNLGLRSTLQKHEE